MDVTHYTIEQLDAAISGVIGKKEFFALRARSIYRAELITKACIHAFVYGGGSINDHFILRIAQTDLDRNGHFTGPFKLYRRDQLL